MTDKRIEIDYTKLLVTCENCGKEHKQDIICNCIKNRLEYLWGEIKAERISYGEIAELQLLAKYIDPDDVELLQLAGVKENLL